MREVGLLLVRSALLVATTHALSSPAVAFRNQHFNPATPIEFDGWHGHESIGIAGADAVPTTIKTQSRRLHLLPNLLPDADRSSLLATLEKKRIEDDVLDTVDAQATFMCRIMQGGETLDAELAEQCAPLIERLRGFVRQRFECETACVSEVLIRRYLPDERRRLEAHFDVSAFATAIVSLTAADEYEGGLYVQAVPGVPSRRFVNLEAGDALVHRFDSMHGVHVASGARYSLVVWFSQSEESLSDGTAPWVKHAAEEGNAEAQFILGGFHYRGDEFGYGPSNMNDAVTWLTSSARSGNALAQVHLASMIGAGEVEGELLGTALKGTHLDGASGEAAAAELYRRAAEQGHPSGQFALGRCYLNGDGLSRDVEQARAWLKKAAAQGADENVAAAWATDELAALEQKEAKAKAAEEAARAKEAALSHEAFEKLRQAITSRGGLVGSLSDGLDASGTRGLIATEDIPQGEPLLVLPPGTYLTTSESIFDARSLEWYESVDMAAAQLSPPLKPFERLLMMLLFAKSEGEYHDLAAYLNTLPSSVDLLRDWSDAELDLLQSDSLKEAAISQAAHVERTCSRLESLLVERYPKEAERHAALTWGESIVRSRSLAVPGASDLLMLPIFDFMNHRSRRREGAAIAPSDSPPPQLVMTEDGGVVLLSGCDLKAGEPIEIEYLQESGGGNRDLLLEYGFAEVLPEDRDEFAKRLEKEPKGVRENRRRAALAFRILG